MRRRVTALTIGPVLALLACAGPPSSGRAAVGAPGDDPSPPPRAFAARVDRVVDGDTFIAVRRGARVRVRLIGVDAPESVAPGRPVECWGPESSALLRRLLRGGRNVRASYEPGGRRDRYGRDLWDVWLPDGRFVQAVLVRRGAAEAVAYRPQVRFARHLALLAEGARRRGAGLWAGCGT
jgi:micrococcal nuclease